MNKQDHDELLNQGLTQQEIDSLTQKGFTKEEMIQAEVGAENYKVWKQLKDVSERKGIQTVLPYELIIK